MRLMLILFCLASTVILNAQSTTVMTYNIRLNIASDGFNAWPNRKQKVADLIKTIDPDIFGVQEALHDQMMDVESLLPEYTYVGVGRDDGKQKGEYTAIFFKKNKFRVKASGSFWLSETPQVPGSIGWDAAITRMATWAEFEQAEVAGSFWFVTTHFDHMGTLARLNSANRIRQWLEEHRREQGRPAIFCGDLNFQPTAEPYSALMSDASLLTDTRPAGVMDGTFCGFEKGKMECIIIDYIFCTNEWKSSNFRVIQDNDGRHYPSDHLPVVVTLTR